MRLAIMQPYLFPYLGYFQLINAVDKFIFYDNVQYINRGWINKNRILLANKPHTFTFPLRRGKQTELIKDKYFADTLPLFKKKFLKTLQTAYAKAPYYSESIQLINNILSCNDLKIANFIYCSLETICNYLNIKTPIMKSSEYFQYPAFKGQKRILTMAKSCKATKYINSIGGIELYSKELFLKNGIVLYFIKTNDIKYKQFKNQFINNLSIIDVLMFNHPKKINNLLNEYTII